MDNITENIITAASEGSTEAFESIYKAYSDFVYNVAFRVVNNIDETQEVTQEVFLTVYRKLKSFKFKSSLKTWVYRIAVNMAIDYARRRTREQDRTVLYEDNNNLNKTIDPVSEKFEREQQEETISTLLETLSPDQRVCIVLRNIEGFSYQEIAKSLDININTVRSRLKRAREKLIDLRREMKCEYVKKLILTDYLDEQLGEEQKNQIEKHLSICGDCKEYDLLTRTAVIWPFNNVEKHNPPEAAWHKIKEQIEEERPLRVPTNSFADLIRRIRSLLYIPRPAFVVTTIIALLLVVITVIKIPTDDQGIVKANQEKQIECIAYLITVFDQETVNRNDDFGTSIEELFL